MLRVCRAVLGPTADAEDAWSETFLSAIRSYPELPAGANVQAWLVTIAHRKAIDVTRVRQRQAIPVGEVPDQPSAIGDPEGGDPDLWRAIETLPDKQRKTVAYHYLGGLSYADIADILGGTTDAARRAAADGINKLRIAFTDIRSKGETR